MLVTITGLLEIAGAIGLLLPRTAAAAAICLAVFLVALFPANIRAARQRFTIRGRPAMSVARRDAGRVRCRASGRCRTELLAPALPEIEGCHTG
jgi:hypothetical protein